MTKEESDLIITEQNKSTEEILMAVAKVKSDYHELCNLKDMRIAELEDKLANADFQLEGRDNEIRELEKKNTELQGALELYESGACRAENHSKCKLVQQLEKEIENYKLSEIEAKEIMAEQEEQIEKMKNCKNCANYMISGKCPCFFRTGWCKNWEMAKGDKRK